MHPLDSGSPLRLLLLLDVAALHLETFAMVLKALNTDCLEGNGAIVDYAAADMLHCTCAEKMNCLLQLKSKRQA